jgi:hypothetical protein
MPLPFNSPHDHMTLRMDRVGSLSGGGNAPRFKPPRCNQVVPLRLSYADPSVSALPDSKLTSYASSSTSAPSPAQCKARATHPQHEVHVLVERRQVALTRAPHTPRVPCHYTHALADAAVQGGQRPLLALVHQRLHDPTPARVPPPRYSD